MMADAASTSFNEAIVSRARSNATCTSLEWLICAKRIGKGCLRAVPS